MLKSRARLLTDFVEHGRPFFTDRYEIEVAAGEKFLKEPALRSLMPELACRLQVLFPFDLESTETTLRSFAADQGVKSGLLINAARVLLTGTAVAPGIFEVMVALGIERTVQRLASYGSS